MNYKEIQPALNPEIGKTRSTERPLSVKEQMQRAKAMCAAKADPRAEINGSQIKCTGTIFIGSFFDDTENNEEKDFNESSHHQKNSNIAHPYHAYHKNNK